MNDNSKKPKPNKNDILKSINQYGFNLEFEVEKKILAYGGNSEIFNFKYPIVSKKYNGPSKVHEIDLFSQFSFQDSDCGKGAFYIECKGSSSDTKLFLVDSPKLTYKPKDYTDNNDLRLTLTYNTGSLPKQKEQPESQEDKRILISRDSFECHSTYENPEPFFCHNGDFFTENKNYKNINAAYKKRSIQDEQNSLFKGITQLEDLMKYLEGENFSSDFPSFESNLTIFPILIVKSDIFVVRYNNNSEDQVFGPVPWVGYRSNLIREFSSANTENRAQSSPEHIYFSIVNVNSLEDFFDQVSDSFTYKK